MADAEQQNSYYHPAGVPITPQARRFGYEFPVWVSPMVWAKCCVATGIPSRRGAGLEQRIWHLLQHCYDGMAKKLATEEDFLYYEFKAHYWSRDRPAAKKMIKWKLGARLFLDPSTGGPWLYIFAPNVDSIDTLVKGEEPDAENSEPISAQSALDKEFTDHLEENVFPSVTGDDPGDHVGPPEMYK